MRNGGIVLKRKILLLVLGGLFAFADLRGEESILKDNLLQMRERKLSIVPLPKRIAFHAPVHPDKIVIVGHPGQPFFEVIREEIEQRFSELKTRTAVHVSRQCDPGAYNVIISDDFRTPANLPKLAPGCESQLYTLTPVSGGIQLAGKENALYAAVTFCHLIDVENGKSVIHPASVTDWPDFPVRAVSLSEPYFRRFSLQPEKYAAYIKPVVRRLLHLKINEIRGLPRMPYAADTVSRVFSRKPLMNEKARESMRQLCILASERGIDCGMLFTTFMLGTREDEKNPEFQKMSRISWNGSFHSWARTDLYARNAQRFNAFLKQAGWNSLFVHAPDTGGSRDPEEWSRRDQATRERFGDDRAAADSAVFLELHKAMENTDVKRMIAVIYPYSGRYLSPDSVREILNLPATPEGKKAVEANILRDCAYLSRMHALLPKEGISFCLREGGRDEMRLFTSLLPGRNIDIYWECQNVQRDIPVLVPPELLSTASAFEPERYGRNDMWIVDGGIFKEPERVMFAERSWNCMGEYSMDLDRSRNPLSYDRKALEFSARRAAEGIWGSETGAKLYPIFDNMLSLHYAFAPFILREKCLNKFDLGAYLERNRGQILKALAAFDNVWNNREKEKFKPGSYPHFIEFYRLLKAASVYAEANLAMLKMQNAARKGDQKEVEILFRKASEALASGEKAYQEFSVKLSGEPWLNQSFDLTGWDKIAPARLVSNLLIPDFKLLADQLSEIRNQAPKLFADSSSPAFLKVISGRNRTIHAVPEKSVSRQIVRHWYDSRHFTLRATPVEANLSWSPDVLRLEAGILIPGIGAMQGERLPAGSFPAGNSFELFLMPPGASYSRYHFAVDPFGTFYSARHSGKANGVFEFFESFSTTILPISIGTAKPMPSPSVAFNVFMPTTCPLLFIKGPPEFPGLIAASC